MSFKNIAVVHVFYLKASEKILMGRLALKERKIFFEYDAEFLKTGIELSPFKLPLKPGILTTEDRLFEGLFGVFNDSLPDGWGRLLLDRMLMKYGMSPENLSPLDRLCYVGTHGMGALLYEPEMADISFQQHKNLDEIASETLQFLEYDDDSFVEDLVAMNGSSAGARPKILVNIANNTLALGEHSSKANHWLIKFRSSLDPKDIGPIEYAYHLMAKAARLDVPEAKLFPSQKGPGYYGVKRFDRKDGKYLHMHTMSGLLHIDHRIPSLDYKDIMKATLWLTNDINEGEKQFRNAIFNVLSHNRDDHAKNFSFLFDANDRWRVSPAYDLTFSSGPAGEHCSIIMGEGKNPTLTHFLQLAEISGISQSKAKLMIEEIKSAVSNWSDFAKHAGVSKVSRDRIQVALDKVGRNFMRS